jgi:DNA-binding CsgD family transcriptional regulator
MQTATARLETALRVSAEWHGAATTEELARRACADLASLIEADGVGWNEIDFRGREMRIVAHPSDYFPGHHELLAELIHESPLVQHKAETRGAARTFSDFVGVREYHRRQLYGDVYRLYGVEDQLGAFFEIGREALIGIAFNRGARTFTHRDRWLLDLLRHHLAAAYRTVIERDEGRRRLAARDHALEAAGQGVVVIDGRGGVADASPLHARWFEPGHAPEPGTYVGGGGELVVRRIDGDSPLLLLDERRTVPDPERVRALGLSRREAEIVCLAGRGLTNAQIAAELFLAERTVHKHLENAFRKLDVHSRTDAVRTLLR